MIKVAILKFQKSTTFKNQPQDNVLKYSRQLFFMSLITLEKASVYPLLRTFLYFSLRIRTVHNFTRD